MFVKDVVSNFLGTVSDFFAAPDPEETSEQRLLPAPQDTIQDTIQIAPKSPSERFGEALTAVIGFLEDAFEDPEVLATDTVDDVFSPLFPSCRIQYVFFCC